jgi:toxin ParE1/3/4
MRIIIHPKALADVDQAANFYAKEGSPALAARFVAEFKRVSALIAGNPGIGSPRGAARRNFGMRVFPYSVIYKASKDELQILVVKHDRQRPGFGRGRV